MKKIAAIIAVVLMIAVSDLALTYNNFIKDSDYFIKNDFEITQNHHPEKIWDKVFFGNSVVISSYIEEQSQSGYINLGLDYGVVTDLWKMIEMRHINIGSELVIGLNYLTLYDEFETNPTYIWHKQPYVPYAYFERDRFYPLITDGFDKLLNGQNPLPFKYLPQEKHVYHGTLPDSALDDTLKRYEEEFFNQPIGKFQNNLSALEKVIEYCKKNNIQVRAVWMPWNPKYEKPALSNEVRAAAEQIFNRHGVEMLNLEDELPSEYFYDTGHLNYDVGSPRFTEILDKWL